MNICVIGTGYVGLVTGADALLPVTECLSTNLSATGIGHDTEFEPFLYNRIKLKDENSFK